MSLAQRRLLYILIIVVFLGMGAASLQFATGHRFDLRSRQFVKVGAVYIKSYPSGASVLLNGKPTGKKTPARLLNIVPGEQTVTVVREGFASWEKKLAMPSGETVFIRDIVLFRSNPRSTRLSQGGAAVLKYDDQDAFLFIDNIGKIHLTFTAGPADFVIETPSRPEALLALSADGGRIAYRTPKGSFIIDVNTESVNTIPLAPGAKVVRAQWDPTASGVLWLLTDAGNLSRFDQNLGELKDAAVNIHDFRAAADRIFILTLDGDRVLVQSKSGTDEPRTIASLTNENPPTISAALANGSLLLSNGSTFWIIDGNRVEVRSLDALSADVHGSLVLLASEFEIVLFDTDTWTETLLDRSSQPIQRIAWHTSGSYFLRQQEGLVELVEIDGRDRRNTVPLLITSATSTLALDRKGSRLFVVTPDASIYSVIQ